jgi:hypothetical protein
MTSGDVTRFIVRGHRDGSCNIAVCGPLERSAVASLRHILDGLQRDHVTLDLTECPRIADEALHSLVEASLAADARGGYVHLHPVATAHRAAQGEEHRDACPPALLG